MHRRDGGSTVKSKMSLVISVCAVLVLFSDPRVLLRVLVPVSGLNEALGLIVAGTLSLAALLVAANSKHGVRWSIALGAYGAASMLRFLVAGYDWQTILQWIPAYLGAAAAAAFGLDHRFVRRMFNALTVAMVLHAISIYVPLEFVKKGLDVQTAYGPSSDLYGRATGFTYAPGLLSLYSSVGFSVGMVMFVSEWKVRWLILVFLSIFCGLGTLNRSFLLGIGTSAFVIPLIWVRLGRAFKKGVALTVVFGGVLVATLYATDYYSMMAERLSRDEMERDLEMRFIGKAGTIPALQAVVANPLIGSVAFNPEHERPMVFNGQEFVLVHNGFAWTFATRGMVFGLLFYYWALLAVVRLWRETGSTDRRRQICAAALLAGYLVGQAVSLVEAFHETFIMLMPVAVGIAIDRRGTGSRLRSGLAMAKVMRWIIPIKRKRRNGGGAVMANGDISSKTVDSALQG
jgi:hypothetical protein